MRDTDEGEQRRRRKRSRLFWFSSFEVRDSWETEFVNPILKVRSCYVT